MPDVMQRCHRSSGAGWDERSHQTQLRPHKPATPLRATASPPLPRSPVQHPFAPCCLPSFSSLPFASSQSAAFPCSAIYQPHHPPPLPARVVLSGTWPPLTPTSGGRQVPWRWAWGCACYVDQSAGEARARYEKFDLTSPLTVPTNVQRVSTNP